MKTLIALWKIASWFRSEKKKMEKDVASYLTEERALEWRLNLEKIFYALETGNGNIEKLPGPVKWLFSTTTVDELVGIFGFHLLKSQKLDDMDDVLKEPYQVH